MKSLKRNKFGMHVLYALSLATSPLFNYAQESPDKSKQSEAKGVNNSGVEKIVFTSRFREQPVKDIGGLVAALVSSFNVDFSVAHLFDETEQTGAFQFGTTPKQFLTDKTVTMPSMHRVTVGNQF